ncbi:hypothetical protein LTR67_009720 [Exophiala xenobiotica]
MFNGGFREAVELHSQEVNKVLVPLPDDNPDAMVILLNIVHGLSRHVPRKINETSFLDVVMLIDKYEFHEAAYVFTDIWFEALWKWTENPPPPVGAPPRPRLFDWIYICWVLRKASEFTDLTKIAIMESRSGLGQSDTGPCPAFIVAKIESQRLVLVNKYLIIHYKAIVHSYDDKVYNAWLQSSLFKKMEQIGLYPPPEPTTLTMSLNELSLHVRYFSLEFEVHEHRSCGGVSKKLQEITSPLDKQIRGLDMASFSQANPPSLP